MRTLSSVWCSFAGFKCYLFSTFSVFGFLKLGHVNWPVYYFTDLSVMLFELSAVLYYLMNTFLDGVWFESFDVLMLRLDLSSFFYARALLVIGDY